LFFGPSAHPEPEMPNVTKKPPPTKRPAAQVEPSRKAAELKAANAAKRPRQPWLRDLGRQLPLTDDHVVTPERVSPANRSQGPPRLMTKREVCALVGASYVSVWNWMRQDAFPRSFVVCGRSMWRSDEVTAWLDQLPRRRLKGDLVEHA
jgi:predicted DNA-binding transcriptional regulator AlpA